MAEVPVFLDSRASRLIQLADLVAYAMKRHLVNADSQWFNLIEPRFYREGMRIVGLATLPDNAPAFSYRSSQLLTFTRATAIVESVVVEGHGSMPIQD